MIAGTAMAWAEALTAERAWDQQRDTPRIRSAFITLAATRRHWPAPRDFLDALPNALPLLAVEHVRQASPEVVARAMAEVREYLSRPEPAQEPKPEREGPPLAEVEASLRQHYDGRAAAAGPDL